MLGLQLKTIVYLTVFSLAILGLMSVKDKLYTDNDNSNAHPNKELFEEQGLEEESIINTKKTKAKHVGIHNKSLKTEKSTKRTNLVGKQNLKKETNDLDNTAIIENISSIFLKNFDSFKKKMNEQMDFAQKVIDDNIKEAYSLRNQELSPNNKEKGIDPISENKIKNSIYYESTENDISDDEDDDMDDDNEDNDNDITESFVEEGMYNGITSPYCLHCKEIS